MVSMIKITQTGERNENVATVEFETQVTKSTICD